MDKINILYVDDEPDLLEIGKLFLEQLDENFVVDTIISASMAMRHLHKHLYDVIVSDYSMPEMDGIEFLKHLKSSGNKTPFIIFTGRGREEIVIKAFDEGADYYVQKGGDVQSQYAELAHKIKSSVKHRRSQEERCKSELRFKNVIDSINQYVFEMDAHATITFVSDRVKDVLGYEPYEILGKTPLDQLYSPEEISRVSKIFAEYGKTKPSVHKMEYICKSKSGDKVIIKIVAVPILNITGKITGYQGVAEDITALKQSEDDTEFMNMILKTQQETSLDGILIVDEDGKILSYNQNFLTLWKIPVKAIKEKSDAIALAYVMDQLEEPDEFISRVEYLYRHKTEKSNEEVKLKDGRILMRYSSPMCGNKDVYYGRVWYFREISC